jgi:hypothetical protein
MIDIARLIQRFNSVHPLSLDRARCHDVDSQTLPANAIHSREDAPVLKANAGLRRSDLDLAKRQDQALKLPV